MDNKGSDRRLDLVRNHVGAQSPQSNESHSNENESTERRVVPRLCLTREQFRVSRTGKLYSVTDLSIHGVGLWIPDSEDLIGFIVGSRVEGELTFGSIRTPVTLVVKNMGRDRVGCEFQDLEAAVSKRLEQFLAPESRGSELKPIPSPQRSVLWYHGPCGTDFFIQRTMDKTYEELLFVADQHFVRWRPDVGVETGVARHGDEKSQLSGIMRLESLQFIVDQKADRNEIEKAKKALSASHLPSEVRVFSLRHFQVPH